MPAWVPSKNALGSDGRLRRKLLAAGFVHGHPSLILEESGGERLAADVSGMRP